MRRRRGCHLEGVTDDADQSSPQRAGGTARGRHLVLGLGRAFFGGRLRQRRRREPDERRGRRSHRSRMRIEGCGLATKSGGGEIEGTQQSGGSAEGTRDAAAYQHARVGDSPPQLPHTRVLQCGAHSWGAGTMGESVRVAREGFNKRMLTSSWACATSPRHVNADDDSPEIQGCGSRRSSTTPGVAT